MEQAVTARKSHGEQKMEAFQRAIELAEQTLAFALPSDMRYIPFRSSRAPLV